MPRRSAPRWLRHHPVAVGLVCLLTAIACVASVMVVRASRADPTAGSSTQRVIAQFPERRDHYIDLVLARTSEDEVDLGTVQGMLLLSRAERGECDDACVADANARIAQSVDQRIAGAGSESKRAAHLGGALAYLRTYLLFRDSDLLTEDNKLKLKVLLRRNYRGQVFSGYGSLDIHTNDPYRPTRGAGGETENHRMQLIVTGMLLAEVFAGETTDRPVSGSEDSYRNYYRTAFLRTLDAWPGSKRDSFRGDALLEEKDSPDYLGWHLGDLWMVRDLFPDPVIQRHAEIMIDRLLAEWAQNMVGPEYTGKTGRNYSAPDPVGGTNYRTAMTNYLLFDNLGYEPTGDAEALFDWPRWAWFSLATSDYNPQSPDFPAAVIELGREKGAGYLVTDGVDPKANWVERDFALGFPVDGRVYEEQQVGGFFTGDFTGPLSGNRVVPYAASASGPGRDSPFRKGKPSVQASGVLTRRMGVLRLVAPTSPRNPRLWVQDGFDETVLDSGTWLFARKTTAADRDVYLAVRPALGSLTEAGSVDGGTILELSQPDAKLVWEVGTSEGFAGFEAFQNSVQGGRLVVTSDEVEYTSAALRNSVTWRADGEHLVNGSPQDPAQFGYSIHNPFMQHQLGTTTASMRIGPYSATYDWSPTPQGDFDTMPSKTVDNG